MNKNFVFFLISLVALFSGCSTRGKKAYVKYKPATTYSSDKSSHSPVLDNKTYSHPTMKPYTIRGITYCPTVVSVGDEFDGKASWYGPDFHGKLTSNGETYNMHDMTAAHKTLPMNTIVKVTNQTNGLSAVVRINDRGPFVATRIIDLSNAAAKKLDMVEIGTAPVTVEVLGFQGKDSKKIAEKKELKSLPQELQTDDYAIQIGSFSSFDRALKVQQKHDGVDGYKTIIKDIDNKNETRMFKVWLSGFKSEDEARDYKQTSPFENSFIVRDN